MKKLLMLTALHLCGLLSAEGIAEVAEERYEDVDALCRTRTESEESVSVPDCMCRELSPESVADAGLRELSPGRAEDHAKANVGLCREAQTDETATDLAGYASRIPLTPLWSIRRRIEAARAKGDTKEESLMRSLVGRAVEVFLGGSE